jgi:hypothetical protein
MVVFHFGSTVKGSVPHNRIFALCFLAGGAIFAGQPIVPGFTHLAGTLQLNHGWTRINTDKNRGKSRSNPCLIEHRLVRRFFRPWNFSASVSICVHPWLRSVSTAWLRLRKSRLFPLTAESSPVGYCTTTHLHELSPEISTQYPPNPLPANIKTTGDRIKVRRTKKKLTLGHVAAEMGIAPLLVHTSE